MSPNVLKSFDFVVVCTLLLMIGSVNGFIVPDLRKVRKIQNFGNQKLFLSSKSDIASLVGAKRAQKFLEDSALLGPIRFVVKNENAILEAVGSYDTVKFKDSDKGPLASLVSDDKTFECHIYLDEIKRIEMVTKDHKSGERLMYITRLFNKDEKPILTGLLQYSGKYEEGSVEWWLKLREIFGENQILN